MQLQFNPQGGDVATYNSKTRNITKMVSVHKLSNSTAQWNVVCLGVNVQTRDGELSVTCCMLLFSIALTTNVVCEGVLHNILFSVCLCQRLQSSFSFSCKVSESLS